MPEHEDPLAPDLEWFVMPLDEQARRTSAQIEAVLAKVRAEGREPDRWELFHLVYALILFDRKMYSAAVTSAAKAMTPEASRSTSMPVPIPTNWPPFTLQKLDTIFAFLKIELER